MDSYLSTEELAERYSVADMDSYHAWFRLLARWRDRRLLREGAHWQLRREAGAVRPVRVYLETQVVRLLLTSDATFAEAVRIEHAEAIRRRLAGA